MENKPKTTWRKLGIKLSWLAVSTIALAVLVVRKAGEGAGSAVAPIFFKETDTEKQKANKLIIGEKTGALIGSLLTLGIVGSYILDLSDSLKDSSSAEASASEKSTGETAIKESIIAETEVIPEQPVTPIDINADGRIDGFDTNGNGIADLVLDGTHGHDIDGDGVIDVNHNGVPIADIEHVSEHIRTVADGTKDNNLG